MKTKSYKDCISSSDDVIAEYIRNVSTMSTSTAKEYLFRLNNFKDFIVNSYEKHCPSINGLISKIKETELDPYSILNGYAAYLRNRNYNPVTLKGRIVTVKNFLEYHDIDITPRKFKVKVKLPKVTRKNKEAISKEDVVEILNVCDNIRLRTYVMLLAATGMRAVEALSVRIKDLDLNSSPAKVFVRGDYTKTKTDRTIFLTQEMTQQLKSWLDYKYRTRRVCFRNEKNEKVIVENRTPNKKDTDLVFASSYHNQDERPAPNPNFVYDELAKSFAKTLDRMGRGAREDGNERRREITLHSFRRFVKTTVSDLGYYDFSEWFIGHSGSTYWRKKESEKAELFKKIEPYLTFLNIHQLERQGADIQSKVQELKDINSSLRERDKVKDDAIAHLSDQLLALSTRLQELERKQQTAISA